MSRTKTVKVFVLTNLIHKNYPNQHSREHQQSPSPSSTPRQFGLCPLFPCAQRLRGQRLHVSDLMPRLGVNSDRRASWNRRDQIQVIWSARGLVTPETLLVYAVHGVSILNMIVARRMCCVTVTCHSYMSRLHSTLTQLYSIVSVMPKTDDPPLPRVGVGGDFILCMDNVPYWPY